jgi:hypothetical protein
LLALKIAIDRADFSALAAQTLDPAQFRASASSTIANCSLRSTQKHNKSKKTTFDTWIRAVHLEAVHVIDLVLAKNDLLRVSIYHDINAIKNNQSVEGVLSLVEVTAQSMTEIPRRRTCTHIPEP